MSTPNTTSTNAALRNFSLAAGGAVLAASAWAGGLASDPRLLDGRLFREEMVTVDEDGAEEGWYELLVSADAVQVRAIAAPSCGDEPRDALLVHLPRTRLAEGMRVNHGFPSEAFRPVMGREYRRMLGRTDYSFTVRSSAVGTEYVIAYDGVTHNYLLGLPAAPTRVHAVIDLDGDRRPDFMVAVGREMYLLLSSEARAGVNLPSAQLWAAAD